MILTAHINHDGQKVVAIIDDELLGRRIDGGDIELKFDSQFYAGEHMDEAMIMKEIRESYMLNCAGEHTISFLREHGLISEDDINIIEGVPYVYVIFSERQPEDNPL